jgi:hypothetical protein
VLDTDGEGGPVKFDAILYELVFKPLKKLDLCRACNFLCCRWNEDEKVVSSSITDSRESASSLVGPMVTSRQITGIRGGGENRSR